MEKPSASKPRKLVPDWADAGHPVFHLEVERRKQSRVLLAMQQGCLPVILACTGLISLVLSALILPAQLYWSIEEGFGATLAALFFSMLLIQLIVGAAAGVLTVTQASPAISGEVELQSWHLLRATTLSLKEIIFAKFAAVIQQSRSTLIGLMLLRFASTITGIIGTAYIVRSIFYWEPSSWEKMIDEWLWVLPLITYVVFVIWYFAQPVIQMVLNSSIAFLASAASRTRSRSVAFGLTGRLALWVMSILLNVGLIYGLFYILVINWADPSYAPIEFFHVFPQPEPEIVVFVLTLTVLLYILVVLALQVGSIALLLNLTQRRARKL